MSENITDSVDSPSLGCKPNNEKYSFFIIDDSTFIQKMLSDMICAMDGVVIGTANNGIEAMKQLQVMDKPVDIITLDINMPILNGITLLPMLKAIVPSTKIVMISAFGKTESIKKTISIGADYFILKPFKAEQVFKIFNFLCKKESKSSYGQRKLRNTDKGPLGVLALVNSEERIKMIHTVFDWFGCNILGVTTDTGEVITKHIETSKNSLHVFIIDADVPVSEFEKLFGDIYRTNALAKIIVLSNGSQGIEHLTILRSYSRLIIADDDSLFEVITELFPIL